MKRKITLFFLQIVTFTAFAQDGFVIDGHTNKISIPFKLINNLIFVPIKVNGVELNFLLDSGVDDTVLFSLEDKKEVNFFNVEKIRLRGLGAEEAIEGLKSTNNTLDINGLKSTNHLLYIILDQDFNLSSHIGIPVNGIIGYQFFRNNLVEINYQKKKIIVFKSNEQNRIKFEKKFKSIPITIEKSKPYLYSTAVIDSVETPAKLLIDIGNSDAFWVFQNSRIKIPKKNFEDYLGKGFSGDIEGRRARVSSFSIGDFTFKNPIIAFPDSSSIRNVRMVPDRIGSVGGEILKRFTLVFDYADKKIYLKKNRDFSHPFTYNKSGIIIQHNGLQWVQETVHLETVPMMGDSFDSKGEKMSNDFRYKFQLKPVFEIANIRKKSAAELSGLKSGDIIISINGNKAYKYSLQQVNALLKSEDDIWINLEVERESQIFKFRFKLTDEL
ncbi:retropepsin-like aspartic protease [Flavobacterium sp. PL02]|uniref:retropepsin-like aspartic protease n=1 Tax=Flavobacterium sp. PL02 TaxID=3088354 RepID=UPI00058098CC|nr:aspartyl protease family protein [Flavobacterium sp. PL02]KIC02769.1 signal protein PDZ [Flavobacterium sp. JRM]MEA9411878.1 aspartyl protease family protein [Flavobacterium sp. PL02]